MKNFLIIGFLFFTTQLIAQTSGDYRSKATGNWGDYTTWQVYNGTSWVNATSGQVPGGTSESNAKTVYLEAGYTVTLQANQSCKDLHLNTAADVVRINTQDYILEVWGKMRLYSGTAPGTSDATNAGISGMISTGGTAGTNAGRIRFKGTADRTIMVAGEISAHTNLIGYHMESAFDATKTATINVDVRAGYVTVTSGILKVNPTMSLRAAGDGTATIAGAITVKSGATLTGGLFYKSSTAPILNFTVESGAFLYFDNTTSPILAAQNLTLSGTVGFTGTTANFPTSGGRTGSATVNTFNSLILNTSSAIALQNDITINGKLTLKTGSLNLNTKVLSYGSSGILEYNGAAAQTTTNAEFPATSGPKDLTINNSAGVSLHAARAITGTLTMTSGLFKLGNFDFTLGASSPAVSGTFSSTRMIVTDGTGLLKKIFSATGNYAFPIGEVTGTAEYTSASITLNTGTSLGSSTYIGMRVVDAFHPAASTASSGVSRYWQVSTNITGVNYSGSFQYIAGSSDVTGTESLIKSFLYSDETSSATGSPLTAPNTTTHLLYVTGTTSGFVTGAKFGTTYTWIGGSGTKAWTTTSNWSPSTGYPQTNEEAYIDAVSAALTITGSAVNVKALSITNCADLTLGMDMTVNTDALTVTNSTVSVSGSLTSTGSSVSITSTASTVPPYGTTINATGTISFTGTANAVTLTKSNMASASSLTINTSALLTVTSCAFGNYESFFTNTNTTGTDVGTAQALRIIGCTFAGKITARSKSMCFQSSTFSGEVLVVKQSPSGATALISAVANSGNTFNAKTTLINNDPYGGLMFGFNDVFNGETTIRNRGADFFIGSVNFAALASFNNHVYIYNENARIVQIAGSAVATVAFNNTALSSPSTMKANVYLRNFSTGKIQTVHGIVTFDNVNCVAGNLNTTGSIEMGVGSGNGVVFHPSASLAAYPTDALAPADSLKLDPGKLTLDRFECQTTSTTLSLGTSATLDLRINVNFIGDLTAQAGGFGFGGKFHGVTSFTKVSGSAAGSSLSYDQTTFYKDVSFVNQSTNFWNIGGDGNATHSLYFTSDNPSSRSVITVENQNTGVLVLGRNTSKLYFNNVIVKLKRNPSSFTSTPGTIQLAYDMETIIDANSELQFEQTAAGPSTIQLGLATAGTPKLSLYGTVNASNWTNGIVVLGQFVAKNDFQLYTPSTADLSTTLMFYYAATFEKKTDIKVQNIGGYSGWWKDDAIFHLHGNGNGSKVLIGTYTFDGSLTIINESLNGNTLYMGNGATDLFYFNKDVLIQSIPVGAYTNTIRLAKSGANCFFKGNLRYEGEFGSVPFGYGGTGTCYFNGTNDQTISCTSTNSSFAFTKLEVNKSSGKLIISDNIKVIVYSTSTGVLTLRKGNIVTNPTNAAVAIGTITLSDDATIVGGGKHSYIQGPLTKQGNDAFKFFIGKGAKYFPMSMTAPSVTSGSFTSEFFDQNIPVANTLSGALKDLLKCQYWKIDKVGTSNPVNITLSWHNETGQNCAPVDAAVVTVARFNSPNWQSEGANNIVSSPGDSGTVQSNALSTMGYFALGSTVANTITANDVYSVLKQKNDGGYYSVVDGKLYFKFEEEYASSGALSYKVYDEQRNEVSLSSLVVQYGDNRYALTTSGLTTGKYYVLEVCNSKKEKFKLRFKV